MDLLERCSQGSSQLCSASALAGGTGVGEVGARGGGWGWLGMEKGGSAWKVLGGAWDGSCGLAKASRSDLALGPKVGMGQGEEVGELFRGSGYMNGVQDLGPCLRRQSFG